jgi:integrase
MPFRKKIRGKLSRFYYVDFWVGGEPFGIHVNKSTRTENYDEACLVEMRWRAEAGGSFKKEFSEHTDLNQFTLGEAKNEISEHNDLNQLTLGEALEWVRREKWHHNRTAARSYMHIRKCIELIGNVPLIELSGNKGLQTIRKVRFMLLGSHNKQGRIMGKVTVDRYMAALRTLLRTIRDEYPMTELAVPKIPMYNETNRRERILSETEEVELFMMMEDGHPEFAALFKFLLDTGLRLSEALQLDYRKHIFLDKRQITVYASNTKTKRPRSVPLTIRAYEILNSRHAISFPRPFPWNPTECDRIFRSYRIKMGFGADKDFVPHMLRHTCTTRLLKCGIPLALVQSWIGHCTAQMTQWYSHFVVEDMREAASTLDKFNTQLNNNSARSNKVKI